MIAASRDQEPAVGAERQAADEALVAAETADQCAGVAVPDFHGAVLTRRGDPPATVVGAERHGVDVSVVSPEGTKLPALLHVPDLNRILLAPRRQPPAIWAENHAQAWAGNPRPEGDTRPHLPVELLVV